MRQATMSSLLICHHNPHRRRCASQETCLTKLASNSILVLLILLLANTGIRASPDPQTGAERPRPLLSTAGEPLAAAAEHTHQGDHHLERQHTNSMASPHHSQTRPSSSSPPPPLTLEASRGQEVKIGLPPTSPQMINELAGVTLTRPPVGDQQHRHRRQRQHTGLTRRSSAGQDNNNNNNNKNDVEVEERGETISLLGPGAREPTAAAAASRLSISNKVNEDTGEQEEQEETTSGSGGGGGSGNNNNSKLLPPAWLLKCRVEKDLYLDFDEYQHYTCANCYNQVPPEYFKEKLEFARLDERTVRLLEPGSSSGAQQPGEIVVWTNDTVRIRQTFKDEEKFDKWRMCCRQAEECCLANSKHLIQGTSIRKQKAMDGDGGEPGSELIDNPERTECPGTWDGLSCWPASPAASKVWHECPRVAYLLDFEPACRGYVTKQCFPNASWFINRHGHEWSDYSTCSPEGLYKKRMLVASVAYICEALIVVPALLIIGKFPNRGGNKRIRIMKHLLFYILLNSLIQALQRGFLAAGYFAEYRSGPMRAEHHARHQPSTLEPPTTLTTTSQQPAPPPGPLNPSTGASVPPHSLPDKLALISATATVGSLTTTTTTVSSIGAHPRARHARSIESLRPTAVAMADDDLDEDELVARIFLTGGRHHPRAPPRHHRHRRQLMKPPDQEEAAEAAEAGEGELPVDSGRDDALALATRERSGNNDDDDDEDDEFIALAQRARVNGSQLTSSSGDAAASQLSSMTKRSGSSSSGPRRLRKRADNSTTAAEPPALQRPAAHPAQRATKRKDSVWKAFSCWFLQMASRLVRLMSYAWMFTGGVYLCSALHCAPAEPPAKFIKILFFLTNAFPTLIFLAYVMARTINEPSPLNIMIKVPYYWLGGDQTQVDQLYATQQVCWFEESKSQSIEDIADLPNMILVGLNVALFVFTLIILCRINRPGSTRPDMSPCAYFKAAGTLLFLYGGHYFFLAYRPESESCGMDTFIFYAFICIDVVQGIAISIVFCYMTQEGKAVISKYWRNRNRFTPFRQCAWLSCSGDRNKLADNGYGHHTPHNGNNHHHNHHQSQQHSYNHHGKNRPMNHSTRSNTSACNGHDNVTELVNLNDTQIVAGQF